MIILFKILGFFVTAVVLLMAVAFTLVLAGVVLSLPSVPSLLSHARAWSRRRLLPWRV